MLQACDVIAVRTRQRTNADKPITGCGRHKRRWCNSALSCTFVATFAASRQEKSPECEEDEEKRGSPRFTNNGGGKTWWELYLSTPQSTNDAPAIVSRGWPETPSHHEGKAGRVCWQPSYRPWKVGRFGCCRVEMRLGEGLLFVGNKVI